MRALSICTSVSFIIIFTFRGIFNIKNCVSQGFVSYQIPSAGVSWASVFQSLEDNKERLGVVDYSISQATLDQVRTYVHRVTGVKEFLCNVKFRAV